MGRYILVIAIVVVVGGLIALSTFFVKEKPKEPSKETLMNKTDLGVFEIENYGKVTFSFLDKDAPKHCARIRHLISIGYYNGKTFHRLAPLAAGGKGRILQGGSLNGLGIAGCQDGVTIPLEANAKHDKGTIGMARTNAPNSANSQFYFNLDSVHGLDGNYTVWGKVEKGMDVLEKIWADNFQGGANSNPRNKVVILRAYTVPATGK